MRSSVKSSPGLRLRAELPLCHKPESFTRRMGGLSPWVSLREQGAFQSGLRVAVREPERLAGRLAPSVSGRSRTLPRRDMCGPMFSCGVRLCVQPSKARVSGVLRIAPRTCGGRNRTLWRYQPHWPPPSAGETARFGEVMGMRMPQQQHPHAHKSAAALPGQPSAGETAPDGRGTSHTAGETTPPARHLRRPRGRYDAHAADRDACATVATVRVRSRPASDRCCPEPAHVQVPDATASAHPQVSVPTSRMRRRPCRGRTSCSRCTASC